MEFLFLNHSASIEALIIVFSLLLILSLVSGDMIAWIQRKIIALNPRKAYTLENSDLTEQKEEPLPPITLAELTTTEALKDEPGEIYQSREDTTLPSELSEQKIDISIVQENAEKDLEVLASTNISGDTHLPDGEDIEGPITSDPPGSQIEIEKSPDQEETISPHQRGDHQIEEASKKEKKSPKKKGRELSPEKKEKLIEMVNSVKTLIARGHTDDARALIVSGLSIDKDHRELNLLMASIYERDHAFEKAEYILKDIAEKDPDSTEVLTRLATVIAMQGKYDIAYELYLKVLSLDGEEEETLYTLTHLASELGRSDDMLEYARSYLRQYPKNPEILWLYSQAQITKGERREAIETLIKLKNLTPYNQEIVDLIGKLVTEEELAGNFGEEKNNT